MPLSCCALNFHLCIQFLDSLQQRHRIQLLVHVFVLLCDHLGLEVSFACGHRYSEQASKVAFRNPYNLDEITLAVLPCSFVVRSRFSDSSGSSRLTYSSAHRHHISTVSSVLAYRSSCTIQARSILTYTEHNALIKIFHFRCSVLTIVLPEARKLIATYCMTHCAIRLHVSAFLHTQDSTVLEQ